MKTKGFLKKFTAKLFGFDKYVFDKLVIEREVIDAIIELASHTHPKEFVSFLEGKIKNKILQVYALNYQEYYASTNSTMPKFDFPLTSNIMGSVHSHPGPSNQPSSADLNFFSKRGLVHLIIKKPYTEKDIQGYDLKGNKIVFDIVSNM